MYGNLAPKGAVVKVSGLSLHALFQRQSPNFHSMEDASAAVSGDQIHTGDVIVITYEGPKGGPGMREMHMTTSLLVGRGMDESCALITDGRFSGSTRGRVSAIFPRKPLPAAPLPPWKKGMKSSSISLTGN